MTTSNRPAHSTALLALLGVGLVSTGISRGAVATLASDLNIALGQTTWGDSANASHPTSAGVDGNPSSTTHADFLGAWTGTSTATPYPGGGTNAPNPYWQVDLATTTSGVFDEIVVYDRTDGCCTPNRLNGSTMTVLDSGGSVIGAPIVIGGFPNNNSNALTPSMTFNNGGAGWTGASSIRIDGIDQYFQIGELQANAFGASTVPVNWALGAAVGLFDNTGSPFGTWPGQDVANLTDGNIGTFAHPNNPTPHAGFYYEIDLGQEIFVDNVDIFGRNAPAEYNRLENYELEFLDAGGTRTHLYTHSGQTTEAGDNIDVIGAVGGNGARAQYVRIINASGANYGPTVAELEVHGVIPEPSTGLLAGLGGLLLFRRRR